MVAIAVQSEESAPVAVPVLTEDRPAFRIDSDQAANWLLSKLAGIEAEIARVQSQAEKIVKQLEGDRDSLLHLYQSELSAFVLQKIEQSGGRRKSVHFLQGSCSFRRVPAHVTVKDTSAALSYVKEADLPGCIKTVEKLDAEAYRALAEAFYEVKQQTMPGAEFVPETDRFSIRFPSSKPEEQT